MDPTHDSPALGRLLAQAHAFDERSRLLAGLALLVAAGIQILVVMPFIETVRERERASAELARLEAPLEEVEELETSISGAREAVTSGLVPALEILVSDLEADLRRVAVTRRVLRRMMKEGTSDEAEAEPETETEVDEPEPFQVDNVDWIFDVGRAESRDESLAALEPLVDSRVTAPRFGELESRWTSSVLPRVEAHLDHLAGAIPGLRGRLPGHAAALDALAAAVAAERRAARDLLFKPPERRDWWTSAPLTTEEELAGETLSLRLDPAVAAQLREPLELDQLRVTAAATETAWRELGAGLEERLAELTTAADRGVEKGAGHREFAAPFTPFLLGLLFALLLAHRASRMRELGLLSEGFLARVSRAEAAAVREWFFLRSGGATRRAFILRAIGMALLALAWISLAAWALRPLDEWMVLAAAGGGALIFAFALSYSVLTVRRIRARLVPRSTAVSELEPPPELGEDFIDDGDGLEGHPLR